MWSGHKRRTTLDLGDVSSVFDRNFNSKASIVINIGGAGSSKSYSLCQLIVLLFFTGARRKILVARKTLPSLRMTTYKVFIDILKKLQLYDPRNHNMSERTYKFKSNIIYFASIDDYNKMKSSEWNFVFLEEADEFTWEDFMQLLLRMRSPVGSDRPNQIFLALNPSDPNDFINQRLLERDDVEVIVSTYLDNPFLEEQNRIEIEKLEEDDPEYWAIYGLGQYRTSRKIIYTNWTEVPTFPDDKVEEFFGLDFGFNVATALVRIKVVNGVPYAKEEIYKTQLGTGELIKELKWRIPNKRTVIYADPEDKRAVQEIYNEGFNIIPAVKEVHNGIEFVGRFNVHYTEDSPNISKERKKYSWKSDKAGNILDEPVKIDDHAMDAIRYAMYTHYMNFGWRAFGTVERTIGISKRTKEKRERIAADDYSGY